MKPARFILNSDYTTDRITGKNDVSVTIPDQFTVPAYTYDSYLIGSASAKVGKAKNSFNVFFESSLFQYRSDSTLIGRTRPSGAHTSTGEYYELLWFYVSINGDTYTLKVYAPENPTSSAVTYYGYGQTITAHILTFKDPFSE